MEKTKFEQWLETGIILASNQEANQQKFLDFISYLSPSRTENLKEILGIFSKPQQELKKALVTQGILEHKLALELIETMAENEENFLILDFADYLELKLLGAKQLISGEIKSVKRIIKTSNRGIGLVILLSFLLFIISYYSGNYVQDYSLGFGLTFGGMIGGIFFLLRIIWLSNRSLLIYQKLIRILTLSLSLSEQQKNWLPTDKNTSTCPHCGAETVILMKTCVNPYCLKEI